MTEHPLARTTAEAGQAERIQLLRRRKDQLARWVIALGGMGVVATMLLIFGYLLWAVIPLLGGASSEDRPVGVRSDWSAPTLLLAVDERGDLAMRLAGDGRLEFVRLPGLETFEERALPLPGGDELVSAARDLAQPGRVVVGTASGRVIVFDVDWERLPGDPGAPRPVAVTLDFPYGEAPRFFSRAAIADLAVSDREDQLLIAATAGRELVVEQGSKRLDFLSGEVTLDARTVSRELPFEPTGVVIDGSHRWITVSDDQGRLHRFDLPDLAPSQTITVSERPITALASLLGGVSVLAGQADGGVAQLFPVRNADDDWSLRIIRRFEALDAPIETLLPEGRRRGFLAVAENGDFGVYHSTSGERVLRRPLPLANTAALAFPPRADHLVQVDGDGAVVRIDIDNPHPEVNFRTLWRKVWYENYPEPDTLWQSTAANDAFEPKLSLTPLAFGTLKASLYAMAFAIPIALLGATYTAVFMAPALRRKVKPAIELMAAMPTVILGFLAGLWLAPLIEENLAALFSLGIILPAGLLAFSFGWSRSGLSRRWRKLRGWEPLLLVPVIVALLMIAFWVAPPLQQALFGGDLRDWLTREAGISYDQRNAIVVGIAMGFSVIPIIFSIAEDALYAVPTSLSDGSLALGATRWQTLVQIVLPTASPGIFSGLMIGLGRAVGETMIVLMATGNTPIMGWSAFEGMRTLAANIAIELPESSVASTHFRVLFLSALVLFLFTFIVNTVAEVVRQRLRRRYASL